MNKHNITIKQVVRLKNVFIKENRTPTAALQLLKEIDHPEIVDALVDRICLCKGLWHKENAITIGKGNIQKLEDAIINECKQKMHGGMMSIVYLEAIARARNFNIEKIQSLIISFDTILDALPEKIITLSRITRIEGANVDLTLDWFAELCNSYPAIKEQIDKEITKINRTLKYRNNKKKAPVYTTDNKISELLDLIKIKQVQDV
jgi:hypothetical protein